MRSTSSASDGFVNPPRGTARRLQINLHTVFRCLLAVNLLDRIVPALAAAPASLFWGVKDVTRFADFDRLVHQRGDVWVVHFGVQSRFPEWWVAVADKLKNVIRVGYVDCSSLSTVNKRTEIGFAQASCTKALREGEQAEKARNQRKQGKKRDGSSNIAFKPAHPQVLGYTFTGKGDLVVATETYPRKVGGQSAGKVASWAVTELFPSSMVQQLTAHAGVNVLHKEELGSFLNRRNVAKAIFFTTSPKGKPPPLVSSLAVFFRQRLLIGEVKASDMTLRNAFGVKDPPEVVVIDRNAKRHRFSEFVGSGRSESPTVKRNAKGSKFSRARVADFLEQFMLGENEMSKDIHEREGVGTEKVKVKRQAYSDAESEQSYPHRKFNPWSILKLRQTRKPPSVTELKKAYKEAAKRWHPDKCKPAERKKCESKMSEAALANQILGDASGRRLQQWEVWWADTVGGRKEL